MTVGMKGRIVTHTPWIVRRRIGQAIRGARQQRGVTAKALANRAGTRPNTISAWERGEQTPSPHYWPSLQRELGVDVGAFVKEAHR